MILVIHDRDSYETKGVRFQVAGKEGFRFQVSGVGNRKSLVSAGARSDSVDVLPWEKMVGAAHPTASGLRRGEGSIWQRRFWEHQIRDQKDYNAHVDYIHYNPVKHGLVKAPKDWKYTTFHRYVKDGLYDREWGAGCDMIFDEAIGNE